MEDKIKIHDRCSRICLILFYRGWTRTKAEEATTAAKLKAYAYLDAGQPIERILRSLGNHFGV